MSSLLKRSTNFSPYLGGRLDQLPRQSGRHQAELPVHQKRDGLPGLRLEEADQLGGDRGVGDLLGASPRAFPDAGQTTREGRLGGRRVASAEHQELGR
jgi:hypothetical protein